MNNLPAAFNILTIACLLIVAVICAWGVLSHHYDDNLMQRVGMSITAIVCIAIAERLSRDGVLLPSSVALALGVTCYALGTAWKHVQMTRERHGKPRYLHCLRKRHPHV